jgi:AraC-like DNA-binding protein
MDRHDVSETVTAEHVAQLHQADLKVQDQFGCRGLTYWFDDKRKTAFCLIEAPDKQKLEEMHDKAHGQIPHSIIEVDATIVESFLGRIEDPKKATDAALHIINDPAFRTIMFIQVHHLLPRLSTSQPFKNAIKNLKEAIPGIVTSYNGKLVKHGAEQLLVSFQSVSNAVHAAIDIFALSKHFTKDVTHEINLIKIGVSAGIPVTDKHSIFEDAIKSAERLSHYIHGEIIVSSEVRDLFNSENAQNIEEIKSITTMTVADEIFLTHLLNYTEQNWKNDTLKADDFCQPTSCSKSKLYRKMTSLTGQSANAFIKEYRLEQALQILAKRTGNVSEVAFETGFSSPSYFSKCFQKRYGRQPSDYLISP